MEKNKELYDAPSMSVVEVKQEGVICTSTGLQNYGWNEYHLE